MSTTYNVPQPVSTSVLSQTHSAYPLSTWCITVRYRTDTFTDKNLQEVRFCSYSCNLPNDSPWAVDAESNNGLSWKYRKWGFAHTVAISLLAHLELLMLHSCEGLPFFSTSSSSRLLPKHSHTHTSNTENSLMGSKCRLVTSSRQRRIRVVQLYDLLIQWIIL